MNVEELDNLNHFSLDMVSTDMNFEQAYSMYNNLQQEQAVSAIESLQKVQSLNHPFQSPHLQHPPQHHEDFDFHRSQILGQSTSSSPQTMHPKIFYESDDESEDEFDKFFSNTESNALEKFLDNLANPSTNPLEFYNYNFNFQPKKPLKASVSPKFSPSSQSSQTSPHSTETLKEDLTQAFSHPPLTTLRPEQLPTPDSRPPSVDEKMDSSRKRKRSSSKPLLSLEQKRLNHSHSEQKRRQLCKLAYERCLRLITNFETYSKQPPANKKSKRRQFTKDGLPNLSKHSALMKISNEICKIKQKNDKLKTLLNSNGVI